MMEIPVGLFVTLFVFGMVGMVTTIFFAIKRLVDLEFWLADVNEAIKKINSGD